MPESFVQFWSLHEHGVRENEVRGLVRSSAEPWPMPQQVALQRRLLLEQLEPLGFDPTLEIWVHDLPHQHSFRLTQSQQGLRR